jgi:acyl carrier protein
MANWITNALRRASGNAAVWQRDDGQKAREKATFRGVTVNVDVNMETQIQTTSSSGERACEEAIARIWAEVLHLPGVERDADFFEIGGDSLKAMEVIARVGDVLQIELPLITFFEEPTVAHLAAVIEEMRAEAGTAGPPPIKRAAGRLEFPLSSSQQMFWLLEQQNPGTGIYNSVRLFRIQGEVDAAVLERSWNELRRRHEILQVRFIPGVDGLRQVVDAGAPLRLAVSDLSTLNSREAESAALKVALETQREPFDLRSCPVLRARLIHLSAGHSLLCIVMHHIVSDGFTGNILLGELGAIYNAFAEGEPSPLPELDLHFTNYAAWEQEWMQGSRLDGELDYWRAALQGAPSELALPADFSAPSKPDRSGRLRPFTVPKTVLDRVQALAQANGTTLFTVLSAVFRLLLYRWTGQADFVIGTIASSRNRNGTERMIGCFVNPLPIRNPIAPGQNVVDLLQAEKSAVMEAFAHQDCPFSRIVEAISPERSSNDNPLFNVALMLQNFPAIVLNGRGFQAESIDMDPQMSLLDLRFMAIETADGLRVSCEYRSQLFSEDTIDAVLRGYADILEAAASDPRRSLDGIALPEHLGRQAAEARRRDYKPAIGIAASFTAEPLQEPLAFLLGELGMEYRVGFAPYQQIVQQLLDPASLVRTADGFAVILVRLEDWLYHDTGTATAIRGKLERLAEDLIAALRAAQSCPATLMVCFCPASRAAAEKPGWRQVFDDVETRIAAIFADTASVQMLRSREVLDLYPVGEYEDEYAQRLGNVPYSTDFFSALGTMLVRRMWGAAENRYKAIAIACDNVMWNGSCAERGQVVDEQRRVLQETLLRLRDSGLLLCLCSRNQEEDVWAAFDDPAMLLKRDDILAAAIGPESNPVNLANLAEELGMTQDDFIFLHADPEDGAEVAAAAPAVLTLQAPADSDEIPGWLKHVWAFDKFQPQAVETEPGDVEVAMRVERLGRA